MVRKRTHGEGVNLSLHFSPSFHFPILSLFSLSLHFLILFPFPFHFLVRSPIPLHFLIISPFSRKRLPSFPQLVTAWYNIRCADDSNVRFGQYGPIFAAGCCPHFWQRAAMWGVMNLSGLPMLGQPTNGTS